VRVHDDWLLTPERAALHLPTCTAVVADLHLGYDQARRRAGEAVPPVSLGEVLSPLQRVLARHRCTRLVIAGDLFEDVWCPDLAAELGDWLRGVGVAVGGVVPGNHDRGLAAAAGWRLFPDGLDLGSWRVVHGDGSLPEGRVVCGHFHPWLRCGRVSAPCYLVGRDRIVLPAFSQDARGVNVRGAPRWRGHRCCASAGDEVLDLGELPLPVRARDRYIRAPGKKP
jgi:metallophosphoesterase superfamily enzyme